MSRSRIEYCTTRVGAALAAALAGLLAASVASSGQASAATPPPGISAKVSGPQIIRPLLAADNPAPQTVQAAYSCDFSAYGPGITPAAISVTADVATPWPVNQPDDITLSNDTIALPSDVSSKLAGVDSIVTASKVTAKHATKATITLAGGTLQSATSAPTEIPAITTLGRVTFAAKGSDGSVALPAQSITFTPMVGQTAKPVITCTTSTAAQDVTITVGDASGAFYHCTTTVGSGSPDQSAGLAPLTIAETGTKKTGDSLTISVTSADIATLISTAETAVAAAGATLDKAAFSADLAVTGAQTGTVHITKTITDLTATSFEASAKLKLTKVGTVKVDIPSKFGLALSASGTVLVDLSCTLVTKPAPVALTVVVVVGATPTPTATTSSADNTGGDTEDTTAAVDATGTPEGGAATGGGGSTGSNLPLAFGGIAMLLAGGGLIATRWMTSASSAARRRRSLAAASGAPDGPSGDSPGGPAA